MTPWTCPFCSLLCDDVEVDPAAWRVGGTDCPRAAATLAAHAASADGVAARIDGRPATLEAALDAAAERIGRWRQPLIGGLGTDVAGARVVARLAQRLGAVCDAADGPALMHGLRALQDRGQWQVTLGEVRRRADLVVCVGTPAVERFPEFFRRCGIGAPGSPCEALVFLDAPVPARRPPEVPAEAVTGSGDLLADLQQLVALLLAQPVPAPHPALAALAARLRAARYAVLVWEAATLPAQGALVVDGVRRVVAALNETTRAASLPLGGSDGALSVNQVFTWLTGLPLRTRLGPLGLEHEPLRFDTRRLLDDHAVDGLLWVSSFDPARVPPVADVPLVVLGPPAMAPRLAGLAPRAGWVHIAVATPGLHVPGHLMRTDGILIVPLEAVRDDPLPGVDAVAEALLQRLAQVPA